MCSLPCMPLRTSLRHRFDRGLAEIVLHFGFLVHGDQVSSPSSRLSCKRLLMAVGGLAPHLDSADRAPAFAHDDPLDLGQPPAMADAHVLGDANSRSGRILRLGRRGYHAVADSRVVTRRAIILMARESRLQRP